MNRYLKREVHNLARFISVMKFNPLSWRTSHPYIVADRFEDVTPPGQVHQDKKCDRNVTLYGYVRGCNMKKGTKVFPLILFRHMNLLIISLQGIRIARVVSLVIEMVLVIMTYYFPNTIGRVFLNG